MSEHSAHPELGVEVGVKAELLESAKPRCSSPGPGSPPPCSHPGGSQREEKGLPTQPHGSFPASCTAPCPCSVGLLEFFPP